MAINKNKTAKSKVNAVGRKAPWKFRFNRLTLAAVFIAIVATGGGFFVLSSYAASWSGALALANSNTQPSGWCMEGGSGSGSLLVLGKCNNTLSQKWQLNNIGTWQGHAVYTVQNLGSKLCVDDWGASTVVGAPLKMYRCSSSDVAEQFIWTNVTNKHGLYNLHTGHCVDDQGGAYATGNHINLYTCKTSAFVNQEWLEIPNSAGTASAATNSTLTASATAAMQLPIKNASGYHMCMDDTGYASADGSPINIWQCNGSAAQTWVTKPTAPGAGTITIQNKCISAKGNAITDGTVITLHSCDGSRGQKWTWTNGGSPTKFVNSNSGKCLDDKGYATTNGTQLEIYTCNGGKNQLWYPVVPSTSSLK